MKNEVDELFNVTHYFRMVGNSMDGGGRRGFIDGDILHCSEVDFQSVQEGDGYVIKHEEGTTVMQVIEVDGEHILAAPLNPSYSEREFKKDEIMQLFIVKTYQRKVCDDIDL